MSPDSDDDDVIERVQAKAEERVTLSRWQYVMLIISAAGGVFSIFSHGIELLHELGIL